MRRPTFRASRVTPTITVGIVLIVAAYLWARLPLLQGYCVPLFAYDTRTYFALAHDLATGSTPLFDLRTPGYPVYLWATLAATGSVKGILFGQQLATLAAALLAFVAFARLGGQTGIVLSTIGSIAVASSQEGVLYGAYLLSDGLYADVLLLSFACLLAGLVERSPAWLLSASAGMGLAILIRPAGSFLAVIYLVVCVTLAFRRENRTCLVAFATAFPALLLMLATYNAITLGRFTVSPWGAANLVGATSTFWVDNPGYPPRERAIVARVRASVTAPDRRMLESSWTPGKLLPVYLKYFNVGATSLVGADTAAHKHDVGDGGSAYMAKTAVLYRISKDAIASRPDAYAKFVYANFVHFLFELDERTPSYLDWLDYGYSRAFDTHSPFKEKDLSPELREYMWREYLDPVPLAGFRWTGEHEGDWAVASHHPSAAPLRAASCLATRFYEPVFENRIWPMAIVLLAGAVAVSVRRAARHPEAAVPVIFAGVAILYLLGAAATVSLVEVAIDRYQYPTRFVYYFAPAMLHAVVEWWFRSGAAAPYRSGGSALR